MFLKPVEQPKSCDAPVMPDAPPNPTKDAEDKIKFIHLRFHSDEEKTPQNKLGITGKGGATVAYRRTQDGRNLEYAFTLCCLRDNFSRKLGRTIATNFLNGDYKHRIATNAVEPNSKYLESVLFKVREAASKKNPYLGNIAKLLF